MTSLIYYIFLIGLHLSANTSHRSFTAKMVIENNDTVAIQYHINSQSTFDIEMSNYYQNNKSGEDKLKMSIKISNDSLYMCEKGQIKKSSEGCFFTEFKKSDLMLSQLDSLHYEALLKQEVENEVVEFKFGVEKKLEMFHIKLTQSNIKDADPIMIPEIILKFDD